MLTIASALHSHHQRLASVVDQPDFRVHFLNPVVMKMASRLSKADMGPALLRSAEVLKLSQFHTIMRMTPTESVELKVERRKLLLQKRGSSK